MHPDQPFEQEPTHDPAVQPENTSENAAPLPSLTTSLDQKQHESQIEEPVETEEEYDDEEEDFLDESEEDLAEYAEFTRLDPDFEHRIPIITQHLERQDKLPRKRRPRAFSLFDPTKTAAERELAEKQQYTAWEREGAAWFNEQHAAGRFDEWLASYQVNDSYSLDSFAKSYGTAYANFRAYGSSFAGWLDEQKLQFRDAAVTLLWQIQQKKLFDLQCRWRAGQVTVAGLDILEDFQYWNDRLHRCSFLPPITDEEFALYRAYTESPNFDASCYNAQDYESLKKEQTGNADDDDVEMPEWYQFHNAHTGNSALLLLPDVRGEREAYYRNVYYAHRRARKAAEVAAKDQSIAPVTPPTPPDPRPRLSWHDYFQGNTGNTEYIAYDFLRRFAPEPGVLQHLKVLKSTHLDDRPHLQAAFDLLLEGREAVPIEAHDDWREALKLTAARYEREQTLAALDVAYDDYKMREQLGLVHTRYNKSPESSHIQLLVERLDVLKGRILCGEPPTFDY